MNRRRILLFGLLVLAASYLFAGGIIDPRTGSTEGETIDRNELIRPAENGSYIWPYTSRDRSADGRTLAINLLIHGSDERVRRVLAAQEELEWEEPDPESEEPPHEEPAAYEEADNPIEWDDAHGSTRYTYVDTGPHGGGGGWIEESYQLHTGTYLGSRYHIRAYTTPHDDWTAIQVHQEYFDWFRLRHSVTDIQESQNTLEAEFLEEPYVETVSREYHGTHDGWNDGWLSVVELRTVGSIVVGFGLLGFLSDGTRRGLVRLARHLFRWTYLNVRGFILAGALAGLVVGVRTAGLAAEAAIPWITPQAFVGVLYPTLIVGLPLTTVVLSKPLDRASRFMRLQRVASWLGDPLGSQSAFSFAVVGLGVGFILDFVGLGITTLPIQLLLHRLGLMVALGLLAAGSAHRDAEGAVLFGIGLSGWIVGLVMPLIGYL